MLSQVGANLVPIYNMDVWEHAYYLDYKNERPSYLNKMWQITNWNKINERLEAAIASKEQ